MTNCDTLNYRWLQDMKRRKSKGDLRAKRILEAIRIKGFVGYLRDLERSKSEK